MLQQGIFDLRPLVTHVVPLAEYPTLMQMIVYGDPSYIKGVVTLGE
jgi:threonine dehydrogenase-like Zn-dependent dehydrogenase